ncbi:MAG: acyl carrier protein [Kineosporiaceae bacterium]|nr:acyl carrier protein [Kineosporiaceae bacterium]
MEYDLTARVLAELASMRGLLVEPDVLRPEHRLREDLGLESVTLIELIVAIEDAFDFRVDPISMNLEDALVSVGSLVAFVREHYSG